MRESSRVHDVALRLLPIVINRQYIRLLKLLRLRFHFSRHDRSSSPSRANRSAARAASADSRRFRFFSLASWIRKFDFRRRFDSHSVLLLCGARSIPPASIMRSAGILFARDARLIIARVISLDLPTGRGGRRGADDESIGANSRNGVGCIIEPSLHHQPRKRVTPCSLPQGPSSSLPPSLLLCLVPLSQSPPPVSLSLTHSLCLCLFLSAIISRQIPSRGTL